MENNNNEINLKNALSDDDLEQVTGGAALFQCRSCGNYIPLGSTICPKCGQKP